MNPSSLIQLNAKITNPGLLRIWSRSSRYGFLNIPYNDPMPADAIFPVGSNTKLYVAVALYQLQEAGKVDLNASIADYLNARDFESFGMKGTSKYCPKAPGSSKCQVDHRRHLGRAQIIYRSKYRTSLKRCPSAGRRENPLPPLPLVSDSGRTRWAKNEQDAENEGVVFRVKMLDYFLR